MTRQQEIFAGEQCLRDPERYDLTRAKEHLELGLSGCIPKKMRRSRIQPWNLVRGSCLKLGVFEIDNGRLSLLKSDLRGWERYWLGCRFMILSEAVLLLELQKLELTGNESYYPDCVRLLACSVLLQDFALAEILLTRILPISWNHRSVRFAPPPETLRLPIEESLAYKGPPIGFRSPYNFSLVGLDPMLLHLTANRLARKLSLPGPPEFAPMGRYAPIIDAWNDHLKIRDTLLWMCDDRILDSKLMREWKVCSPDPWILVPVEIMTIYRVRRDLGAETPTFSHPVLESPFDKLPENVPRLSDPLLDQAAEWARQRYPELADAVF